MERPITLNYFCCKKRSNAKWASPTRNKAGLSASEDATCTRRVSCSCETMGRLLYRRTKVTQDLLCSTKLLSLTSSSVTTSAGQPSLFSSDWTIDRACEPGNNYTVPDNLRYHLLIQRFLARVDEAMSKRTCSPTAHAVQRESDGLMRLLECDLEDLERWIGKEAGGSKTIHLISLKRTRLTCYRSPSYCTCYGLYAT